MKHCGKVQMDRGTDWWTQKRQMDRQTGALRDLLLSRISPIIQYL